MEQADLEVQESYKVPTSTYNIAVQNQEEIVFKCDKEGNVTFFDKEGFKALVANTEDPYLKAFGAIYELGFLDGLKS